MSGLPQTRDDLINWCLRELGAPVLQINIDDQQIQDRIDEGLSYFHDYHFDGVEHIYVPHKLTASTLTFAAALPAVPNSFKTGEIIVGQTSGATGTFYDQPVAGANMYIRFRYALNSVQFQDGETIVGMTSTFSAVLAATNSIVLGDLDNEYITMPSNVISLFNLVSFNTSPSNSSGMFDVRYQFALNDMYNLLQTDVISYVMFKESISLWQFIFNGEKNIRYNRISNKVRLDVDWQNAMSPDMYILFEGWGTIDPEAYPGVYKNLFVRKYCTALLKRQWGTNLKKLANVPLLNGILLNGQKIYDEANQEIETLEKRIDREWQLPPTMLVM